MNGLRGLTFISCILVVLLMSACGYRFTGGGAFPSNVKTIFISILKNKTSESGLETIISNHIIDEFTRMRKDALAGTRDGAEAILTGAVAAIDISTITHQDEVTSNERRVKISVDVKLTGQDGLKLWEAMDISADEAYDVVPGDKTQTNQNKRRAMLTASERLAEKVFGRLTEDF